MASWRSILPSLFPPLLGLSYSARTRNPFGAADAGCGVILPNSSAPLSIRPFPLRSRTRKALVELAAVHAICNGTPSLRILKITPPEVLVVEKPLPSTSMMIGDVLIPSGHQQ